MITTGTRIHATQMHADSYYLEAKGIVTSVVNGYANFEATEVKDRWSKKWSQHPTSCATSVKLENAIEI